MDTILVWPVSILGAITILGVFYKMKEGFGPFNLRAVGIVFVGSLAALLGLKGDGELTAATGILGAIIGYLFGIKEPTN